MGRVMKAEFFQKGWGVFAPEAATLNWARHALGDAIDALHNPAFSQWHQCENTWFVGLDVLSNDAQGCIAGSAPLSGSAVDFIAEACGGWPALHRGQVSGVFPGYPRPRAGETEAGFRYRAKRDAAHVDGVLGVGTPKRRFVQEPHAFILGLPLTRADRDAAPLVVWEGSHRIMKNAFNKAFSTTQATDLSTVDVTEVYQSARRAVFETCPRVIVHGPPGSAIVVHRLALHGVAPWAQGATADPEGRLIAYFRPPIAGGVRAWIEMP
ncbi:hypothetical protein SAMN05443635_10218 [Roseobacter denitrificans OCh 114]|uniref:Phytanoyl-CoA dioxygenase n=2 Tax=Roseobacter denitrificans TaxID=2434 RepID=Q166M8_ROSDO|nr:hypothetical protein RD1_2506 [Roseobacter denitrificans OCh 114]SFF76868.1 hypothetical protein SAMN05443635_10218 [Roseobacter denitrificans OCh 114]